MGAATQATEHGREPRHHRLFQVSLEAARAILRDSHALPQEIDGGIRDPESYVVIREPHAVGNPTNGQPRDLLNFLAREGGKAHHLVDTIDEFGPKAFADLAQIELLRIRV